MNTFKLHTLLKWRHTNRVYDLRVARRLRRSGCEYWTDERLARLGHETLRLRRACRYLESRMWREMPRKRADAA